jgi:hypothetical protein
MGAAGARTAAVIVAVALAAFVASGCEPLRPLASRPPMVSRVESEQPSQACDEIADP